MRHGGRRTLGSVVAAVVLLGGVGVVAAHPASAVNPTIAVTTTSDVIDGGDGVLSLREAVIKANTDAGADTIQLATSATYRLTRCDGVAAQEDAGASGDLDATDVAGLTLSGGGSEVQNGCDTPGDDESIIENRSTGALHLDHVTLKFAAFLAQRSGVESVGPVFLDTVHLVGIGANAVHTSVGGLTAVDCVIEQNRNGLDIAGTADLTDCTINNQLEGAAVFRGEAHVHRSTIVRNTGGIVGYGDVQIDHTDIEQVTDGSDPSTQLGGGGAIAAMGVLDLSDSTIRHNYGTGQYAAGVTALGGGNIARSDISDNVGFGTRVDGSGAVGVVVEGPELTIEDSSINRNRMLAEPPRKSLAIAAGIAAERLHLVGSEVVGNSTGFYAGGVEVSVAGLIEASTIAGNTSVFSGAVTGLGDLTVRNSTVTANPGGGISMFFSDGLEVDSSTIVEDDTLISIFPSGAGSVNRSVLGGAGSPCESEHPLSGGANFLSRSGCGLSPLANVVNGGDPQLSTLGDHGGPTPTMAPLVGSPVIDRIPVGPACTGTDQRGTARPQGPACDVGAVESSSALFADGSAYTPLDPVRVLDTRNGTGGLAPLGSAPESLVLAGTHGVPADATAVVLNVTGTDVFGPTFVTVYPGGGGAVPGSSNLNLEAYHTAANLVTVKLGGGGAVSFSNAIGTINVIADLMGFYAPAPHGTSTFTSIAPERLGDSRDHGVLDTFGPQDRQWLVVAGGTTPVPADASAVAVNITATDVTSPTFVTAFPKGGSTPNVSNLNVTFGETRANLAIVRVGADRSISLYNDQASVNLIVDVVGYFTSDDTHAAFVGLAPTRLIDTRTTGHIGSLHTFADDESQAFVVTGGSVPADATAVVVNVTVTDSTIGTYVTVYPTPDPADLDPPDASSVNVGAYQTNPNLVIVKVGAGGKVSIYNRLAPANVIVDLVGYFR